MKEGGMCKTLFATLILAGLPGLAAPLACKDFRLFALSDVIATSGFFLPGQTEYQCRLPFEVIPGTQPVFQGSVEFTNDGGGGLMTLVVTGAGRGYTLFFWPDDPSLYQQLSGPPCPFPPFSFGRTTCDFPPALYPQLYQGVDLALLHAGQAIPGSPWFPDNEYRVPGYTKYIAFVNVPEPGSFGLLLGVGVALLTWRLRHLCRS
jgi:hypothetical protein